MDVTNLSRLSSVSSSCSMLFSDNAEVDGVMLSPKIGMGGSEEEKSNDRVAVCEGREGEENASDAGMLVVEPLCGAEDMSPDKPSWNPKPEGLSDAEFVVSGSE